MVSVMNIIADLIASAILGGIIGAQRQAAHKPAGFRTHLLVALGSCAFMEASRLGGDTRIGAGVITGVGFLGAGSIVRDGLRTRGLTTAASIWAVAAIGLALGFGTPLAYILAAATTLLVFGALAFTDTRLEKLFPRYDVLDVKVSFDLDALGLDDVHRLFAGEGIHAKRTAQLTIRREGGRRLADWQLLLSGKLSRLTQAISTASKTAGVAAIETADSSQP